MLVETFGEILRNVQLHNDEVTRFGGPGTLGHGPPRFESSTERCDRHRGLGRRSA
jgi:hypothetical protein